MPFSTIPAPEGYVSWACLMACGATRYVTRPRGARIPRDLIDCCSTPVTSPEVPPPSQEATIDESDSDEPISLEELLPQGIFDE